MIDRHAEAPADEGPVGVSHVGHRVPHGRLRILPRRAGQQEEERGEARGAHGPVRHGARPTGRRRPLVREPGEGNYETGGRNYEERSWVRNLVSSCRV